MNQIEDAATVIVCPDKQGPIVVCYDCQGTRIHPDVGADDVDVTEGAPGQPCPTRTDTATGETGRIDDCIRMHAGGWITWPDHDPVDSTERYLRLVLQRVADTHDNDGPDAARQLLGEVIAGTYAATDDL